MKTTRHDCPDSNCTAPVCPMEEENNFQNKMAPLWSYDQEICGQALFRDLTFIKLQLKIKELGLPGVFAPAMLDYNWKITKKSDGLTDGVEIGTWLRNHPADRAKTTAECLADRERRVATRMLMERKMNKLLNELIDNPTIRGKSHV